MSIITHESWFSRIGGSIKGMFVGALIGLVAFPLLFWNEGRAVFRAKTLAEGRGVVLEGVSIESIDEANEGKLVHMNGTAESHETLQDEKFGINVDRAIKLQRVVEMFQWKETKHTKSNRNGGGRKKTTTFEYELVWSEQAIDSSKFDRNGANQYGSGNPPMPFQSESYTAKSVELGAFKLAPDQVNAIRSFQQVPLEGVKDIPDAEGDETKTLRVVGNEFYQGEDPNNPKLGDIKVHFREVGPTEVSLVYQQKGDSFVPFKLATGSINLFSEGTATADQMFTDAETANTIMLWLLRLAGFALMALGVGLVLRPLAVLSDVVPFLGGLVGFGVFLIAILVAGFFSLITIAIAWLFYRPILAIALIVVAIVLIVLARRYMMTHKSDVIEIDTPVVMG